VAIFHGTPKLLATVMAQGALPLGGWRVAMTTWETDTIPGEFVANLAAYDRVIVPSRFCQCVLWAARDRHGQPWLDDLVQVVPHCFDSDWWTPAPVSTPNPVNFYSVGAWSERKNMEAVIKAYLHAFDPHDPVHLTIVSTTTEGQRVTHAFQSVLARSGLPPAQRPPVTLIHEGPLGDAEMRDLIQRQHVYVNASRGEGWGLSVFEAALAGQIVLSTLASGEQDYLRQYTNVHQIDAHETPCFAGPGLPIARGDQIVGEKTLTVPGMTARGSWIDIDVIDLAEAMFARAQALAGMPPPPPEDDLWSRTRDHERFRELYGYAPVAARLVEVLAAR